MRKLPSILLLSLFAAVACSDDDKQRTPTFGPGADAGLDSSIPATTVPPDAGPSSDGTTAALPVTDGAVLARDCIPAPTSAYLELINACTDAEKVDKNPVLPLLQPDGGLPPLP